MGLRILVLGRLPAETLRALRAIDGGSEILEGDDARGLLERIADEAPDAVTLGARHPARPHEAHPVLRALDNEFARAVRYRHPISILCASVDGLDELRAAHGAEGVEAYLAKLEDAVRASLRAMDLAARLDANEIVVVLPDTGAAGAMAVAQRLRTLAGRLLVKAGGGGDRPGLPLKATCSFGVADAPAEGIVTARDALDRARAAMAAARAEGGDRVGAS